MEALVNDAFRRVRRFSTGPGSSHAAPFAALNRHFARAEFVVRAYYLASVYISFILMMNVGALTGSADHWSFLWPLAWAGWFDSTETLHWLAVACFLASLLALQFWRRRLFRFLFIALFLPACTIPNSFGGISHPYHAWFWIGFCLLFLPDTKGGEATRTFRMAYLTVITATQALLLFFYSLAGFWKLVYGVQAMIAGYEGNFAPRGLALTLADRQLQTGTDPLLAGFFIANYWLAWPAFLTLIYVQVVAVAVAFRPRLHVLWGHALILFHLGTYLLMEIGFAQHVLFLTLFFVMSPFRPAEWSLRAAGADLPILGPLLRRFQRRASGSPATSATAAE